ncbi:hypothetical protein Patl1_04364 [Pistacia atlantica]|uniref:Uncharacterized protein n=1 Tax=Pistacia atlantica TaxID=434234 RepID=A0ACC1BPC9_9ROSI|nr:hypothetical protein Patl1_04364 [Pistacia atlantica]
MREGEQGFKEIFSWEELSVLHLQLDSFDNFAFDAQWLRRPRKFNICIGPRSSDSNYRPTQHDEKRVVLRGVDVMGRGLDGLLWNSSALVLENCGGKSTLSELFARKSLCGLPGLKSLTISSCSSIIRLISWENVLRSMLPNLESLTLTRLRNFGSIFVGVDGGARNGDVFCFGYCTYPNGAALFNHPRSKPLSLKLIQRLLLSHTSSHIKAV